MTAKNKNAAAKNTTTTAANIKLKDAEMTEQLNRAYAHVLRNQIQVLELHRQWRSALVKLSFGVVAITMHQARAPMHACIQDVKRWNGLHQGYMADPMTGFETTLAIIQDSMVELVSIMCAVSLAKCLLIPLPTTPSLIASRRPWADFSTSSYSLATLCIPIIFGCYFGKKTMGCLRADQDSLLPGLAADDERTTPIHQFPVIFIFFTIASLSLGFMQYQGQKQQANVNEVLKLQQELRIQLELKKKQ